MTIPGYREVALSAASGFESLRSLISRDVVLTKTIPNIFRRRRRRRDSLPTGEGRRLYWMETCWLAGLLKRRCTIWPIGLALGQGRSIALLVHGRGNMSVSHEFLLHAYGCSGFAPPKHGKCVAEYMETDPAKSQLETCGNIKAV